MGGGTTLAMRWNHRRSTDIDLAVDGALFQERIHKERTAVHDRLKEMKEAGAILKYRFSSSFMGWENKDGNHVSLIGTAHKGEYLVSEEVEAETHVPLVRSDVILEKKISGRILGRGILLDRDGYDLACAIVLDPESYKSAISELTKQDLGLCLSLWQNAQAQRPTPKNNRALLDCRYPYIQSDPWGMLHGLLNGDRRVEEILERREDLHGKEESRKCRPLGFQRS